MMKVKEKAQFKTVAVPLDTYNKLKSMASEEDRSIARQLKVILERYQERSM
jgi:predicted CopG family antitoxin